MHNRDKAELQEFNSFDEFFTQVEERPGYRVELVKLEFTEEVIRRMKELNLSNGELATRLGSHPGLITRFLSGRNNFTLATMVRIAQALNSDFCCHLQPAGTKTCWIDVLNEEPARKPVADWNPAQFQKIKEFQPIVFTNEPIPAAA